MKVLKQPILWIGVGALLCAIVIAVVSTLIHPSSSVIDKYEKALNKQDMKLLAECMNPNVEEQTDVSSLLTQMTGFLAMMGIQGDVEFEILVGDADVEIKENIKNIPTVFVIKANDKVMHLSVSDQRIITIDGKEYLYDNYH